MCLVEFPNYYQYDQMQKKKKKSILIWNEVFLCKKIDLYMSYEK